MISKSPHYRETPLANQEFLYMWPAKSYNHSYTLCSAGLSANQPAVLFSHTESAPVTSQLVVFFSHNKSVPATASRTRDFQTPQPAEHVISKLH